MLTGNRFDWKRLQNDDGGWAYGRGSSWTEPTVFALLAQSVQEEDKARTGARPAPPNFIGTPPDVQRGSKASVVRASPLEESFQGGVRFLGSVAQADGGFRPQPGVAESTWVTSLVALLPAHTIDEGAAKAAIGWLKRQTGQESGWRYRFQQWRAGNKESFPEAWSWFPGAAAWAIPTTMGILAFERALKCGEDRTGARPAPARLPGTGRDADGGSKASVVRASSSEDRGLRRRIDTAREFLLGRQCADGGWNHGSNRALGRDGDSYPETTGLTLLAFAGAGRIAAVDKALNTAHRHLAVCRTAEGISWLRMGLAAHGRPAKSAITPAIRTNMDAALMALADAPRNPLLS